MIEIRRYKKADKKTDMHCLFIIGAIFFAVVIINLFNPNRRDISEVERRELAKMPEFSFASLVSGEYTSGISSFVSDNFIFRDNLVLLSKKLDTLYGVNYKLNENENFIMLNQGNKDKDESDEANKLNETLKNLNTDKADDKNDPNNEPDNNKVTLSKSSLNMTVGGGASISADIPDGINVTVSEWSIDNADIVSVSSKEGNTVNLKAIASGDAILKCTLSDGESAECKITVAAASGSGGTGEADADFMTNGLFIYNDAVYSQGYFSDSNFAYYADTASYYKKVFPNSRINVCIAPTSAILIENESLLEKLPDQKKIFATMASMIGDGVNFVDVCSEMLKHTDEYLYFKSDHHWTQRGAYYAYKAFAESVGFDAVAIDKFSKKILNEEYQGSMYEYTRDDRVKTFYDTIEAYMPTKKQTMTINTSQGTTETYDTSIVEWSQRYSAFLAGDNPCTVINVPENPQNLNILVIKDSFGNAMVPYLSEHYGNIIVVDTRYADFNIKEQFAGYDFTDVLFINNLEAANSLAWPKMYLRAVGVSVD